MNERLTKLDAKDLGQCRFEAGKAAGLEEGERVRELLVSALAAYRSALRCGEAETERLVDMGHRAFEASHRLRARRSEARQEDFEEKGKP